MTWNMEKHSQVCLRDTSENNKRVKGMEPCDRLQFCVRKFD